MTICYCGGINVGGQACELLHGTLHVGCDGRHCGGGEM